MALEIGSNPETYVGGSLVTGALVIFARKMYIDWMKGRPEAAGASTMEAQFKTLRNQIDAQDAKIAKLTAEQQRQDDLIHKQQIKITRTEVLLRQFMGVAQQNGIDVPEFMQSELEKLLKPEPEPKQEANHET